jgi:hypothetical protein
LAKSTSRGALITQNKVQIASEFIVASSVKADQVIAEKSIYFPRDNIRVKKKKKKKKKCFKFFLCKIPSGCVGVVLKSQNQSDVVICWQGVSTGIKTFLFCFSLFLNFILFVRCLLLFCLLFVFSFQLFVCLSWFCYSFSSYFVIFIDYIISHYFQAGFIWCVSWKIF